MLKVWIWLSAALFLALPVSGAVAADDDEMASPWVRNAQGEVRLVSAVTGVGQGDHVQIGLEFHNRPGWKIYWRSPGDAGLPPSIDWSGSDNLAGATIAWPAPHRFSYAGLETMGYEDEIVLPVSLRLNSPGRAVALRAKVDYLICSEVCVPRQADLALAIGVGPAAASASAHLIGRFLARVPGPGAMQGMTLVTATAPSPDTLEVVVDADPPLVAPDLFVERGDGMQFGPPHIRFDSAGKRVVFFLRAEPGTGQGTVSAAPVTLTVVDGDRGMEATTPVAPGSTGGARSLIAMLGIALLGGLILNLMPCVLPVLSLKLLAMVGHGGAAPRTVRVSFLFSAAGILVSFLALAAAAILARSAGMAVGWGMQFQQPLFLVAMVALVTLFSANLFGFYEIPLPAWAVPESMAHHEARSHAGHFLQGAFATLLATPCSAPFLGTAIGFALARGALEIALIFAALGFGMAIPYLAVALRPGLVHRLPRPGRWMVVLRAVLGLALIGTAAWLLLVLSTEAGPRAAAIVAALMGAALVVLAFGRRMVTSLRAAMVAAFVAAAAAAAWMAGSSETGIAEAAPTGNWRAFDRADIANEVADGKTVFVDVTADWCLTCKLNKRAVIDRGAVAQHLAASGTVAMRGDWTRPDPAIGAYLAGFGRYGIPFDAVYGPGAPNGIALPELLTEGAVLDALARAAKPAS